MLDKPAMLKVAALERDQLHKARVDPVEQEEIPILIGVPEGDVDLGLKLTVLGIVDVKTDTGD